MYKMFFILHFLGAVFMFTAVGINLASMIWMAFSKETKLIRNISFWSTKIGKYLPFSIILLLVSSIYLVLAKWDWEVPWIDISFVTLVILTITSITIDLPGMKAIHHVVKTETANIPSAELIGKVRDHRLWNSVSIMAMEVAAVIHIMIEKLGIEGSLITVGLALIIGLIFPKIVLYIANRFNPAVAGNKIVDN